MASSMRNSGRNCMTKSLVHSPWRSAHVGAILPIPKVPILAIIMLIFGLGEASKWVIIAIGVFFQVLVATATGVANIDRIYFDVGRNFKAGRLATYRKIALPGALPTVFA